MGAGAHVQIVGTVTSGISALCLGILRHQEDVFWSLKGDVTVLLVAKYT